MPTRLQRGPRESPAFCGNLASVLHPCPLPSACRHPRFPPLVLYQEDGLSTARPQWSSLIFISSQIPKYQQGIRVHLARQQHLRNIFSYKKKKKKEAVTLFLGVDKRSPFDSLLSTDDTLICFSESWAVASTQLLYKPLSGASNELTYLV